MYYANIADPLTFCSIAKRLMKKKFNFKWILFHNVEILKLKVTDHNRTLFKYINAECFILLLPPGNFIHDLALTPF